MIVDALLAAVVFAGTPAPEDDYWYSAWGPMLLSSEVTPDSALQTTAVMACIGKRARTLACLPFHIYEYGGPAWAGSKRQVTPKRLDHPLRRLLQYQPNKWQTGFEFCEMMEGHVCQRGNAYAVKVPGVLGAITELVPKHPDRMQVFRLENGRLGYLYTTPKGAKERYTQDQIFHLRGYSLDGMTGIGPIALHRHAIELAQHAEDHGVKYFKAGKPLGAVTMPEGQTMGDDPDAHARFRKDWREAHAGDDLLTVAILEDGMQWQAMGLSNEDAQYLESRRFQTVEICRIFDVPPHLIYSAIEHGHTYANVENTDLHYVKHCAQSWACRWEQAIQRDLIVEPDRYFGKFSMEGLLRADTAARDAHLRNLVELGVKSPNDVAELLDLPTHPAGEQYYIRSDLLPLGPSGPIRPAAGQPPEAMVQSVSTETVTPQLAHAEAGEPPAEESGTIDHGLLLAWVGDVANRITAGDIRELGKRATKAGDDRQAFDRWAHTFWSGNRREYVAKSVAPLADVCGRASAEAIAHQVVEATVAEVTAGDPIEVLATWEANRATHLTGLLMEVLTNDRQSTTG